MDSLRILVGALGPRVRELAARIADGILFNWLTPVAADAASAELHAVAPGADAVLYVRTIGEAVARPTLEVEVERYLSIPSYAANFDRLGIDLGSKLAIGEATVTVGGILGQQPDRVGP